MTFLMPSTPYYTGRLRQICRYNEPKCDKELFCARGVCTPEVEYMGGKNRDIAFQSNGETGRVYSLW